MTETWIDDGEKYALVGLSVQIEGAVPRGEIGPGLWALSENRFEFPSEWREWLGTVRAEDVESSNIFLMSKRRSAQPDVLDGENKELQHLVGLFYVGLLLSSRFATAHICKAFAPAGGWACRMGCDSFPEDGIPPMLQLKRVSFT